MVTGQVTKSNFRTSSFVFIALGCCLMSVRQTSKDLNLLCSGKGLIGFGSGSQVSVVQATREPVKTVKTKNRSMEFLIKN